MITISGAAKSYVGNSRSSRKAGRSVCQFPCSRRVWSCKRLAAPCRIGDMWRRLRRSRLWQSRRAAVFCSTVLQQSISECTKAFTRAPGAYRVRDRWTTLMQWVYTQPTTSA